MKYNYDIDDRGSLVKAHRVDSKVTPKGNVTQYESESGNLASSDEYVRGGKRKGSKQIETRFDAKEGKVNVDTQYHDKKGANEDFVIGHGHASYPTHTERTKAGAGGKDIKFERMANPELPRKSFSSDDVTVARLLKGKSPEEAQVILDTLGLLDKAISSVYSASGALSSKRSGGHEGVKLMGEIDKHKKKEPSELDPGHVSSVSGRSSSLAPSNEELTNRKVNPKGLEALKRMSGSTVKSIMDLCDNILEKAKGTQPKDRSLLEGPYAAEAQARYDKKKPAIEAHAKKNKENLASTKRAVEHFRSKADEGFGESDSNDSEKSLSLDFNKSILERMGLEKGRKSAWEGKKTSESSDVRVPHSSDSSAGNLNPETETRMQGIRESGDEKSKKRMSTSTDPSDVAYAKKKGWI